MSIWSPGDKMIRILVFAAVMMPTLVFGADCSIENARYMQVGGSWSFSFKPVPELASSNQTAAFIVEFPNSALTLEGRVFRPNGFGSATYVVEGPCAPDRAETCGFIDAGSLTIYARYADGIAMLDDSAGAAAPLQVLLPELSQGIWYSDYRRDEFDGSDGGDVFTLVGCGRR